MKKTMWKRVAAIGLASGVLLSGIPGSVLADGLYISAAAGSGIPIDQDHFPDINVRAIINSTCDSDDDDVLSADEIASTTQLDFYWKGIYTLEGIEYFYNLRELRCGMNSIMHLDVSKNTALEHLECKANNLESLDVSKNTKLQQLSCAGNELTSLNISNNTALWDLDCSSNLLTSLDVSNNRDLLFLSCDDNQLASLDVSKNTALSDLWCSENRLTSLDVSKNTALEQLACYSNRITSLDIRNCPNLENAYHNGVFSQEDGYYVYEVSHSYGLSYDKSTALIANDAGGDTPSGGEKEKPSGTVKPQPTKVTKKITVSKKPTINKPAAKARSITVKWKHFKHTSKKTKKIWKGIRKVQVQCSTDVAFKHNVKTSMVAKGKTKAVIKGLHKKTTYYVRVRYFDGTGYSAWSKVKKIKTK